MARNGDPDASGWLRPALAIVGAITLARVILLAFARHDLFVDEAQYWLWGQDFAFGYYSKPPMIGWVIGATTRLAGSDAAFWVRLPAPLFHAATALILGGIAARLAGGRAAVAVAAAYATLPMVTVGSLLISTDTIMFPFLALAIGGYLALLAPGGGGRPPLALAVGVALGLATLAKYSALFSLGFAALAALWPKTRPDGRDALMILAAFAVVVAPNVAWNVENAFSTFSHTVDNSGLREGVGLDPLRSLRFLAEQLAVFGPVLFVALVLASLAVWRGAGDRRLRLLAILALPVVLAFAAQALLSRANANWAAPAYLAGTLVAVPWLMQGRRAWLVLSFVLHGAVAIALPLATVFAERLTLDGEPLLRRYLGLDELSRAILAEAEAQGAGAIVAPERAVLADLRHTGRDAPVQAFAWPHEGPPQHHYDLRFRFPGAEAPVLAVTRGGEVPPCAAEMPPDGTIMPGPGAYQGSTFRYWVVPGDCWAAP